MRWPATWSLPFFHVFFQVAALNIDCHSWLQDWSDRIPDLICEETSNMTVFGCFQNHRKPISSHQIIFLSWICLLAFSSYLPAQNPRKKHRWISLFFHAGFVKGRNFKASAFFGTSGCYKASSFSIHWFLRVCVQTLMNSLLGGLRNTDGKQHQEHFPQQSFKYINCLWSFHI